MKYLSILILPILLASCGLESKDRKRAEFWKNEIAFLNTEKINLAGAQERYAEYAPMLDESQRLLTVTETSDTSNFVCDKWHYIITIKLSDTEVVERASFTATGNCL
ncbi:hypothetical protein MAH4_29450 [Sessilibacter sp. MAH4]